MRIIRKAAYQGHEVPKVAGYARDPFPTEVMAGPVVIHDDNDPDMLYPLGATAQNNYASPKMYICRYCDSKVSEFDLENHMCDDVEEDEDGEEF